MIKNGVPYSCETCDGSVDDRLMVFDTPKGVITAIEVGKWIRENVFPADEVYRVSSYGLKHILENDTKGIYLTNNQFKHAMLLAGFKPVDYDELNWHYCISLKRDIDNNHNPFVAYLKEIQSSASGPEQDFIEDVVNDKDFPIFADKTCIENYLFHLGACARAMEIFYQLFDVYLKSSFWCIS